MSTEKEKLLDHAYDGIQEYDNPLPRWWTWIFWATVLFSVGYWWNPGGLFHGPGRIQEYQLAMAAAEQKWPAPAGGPDAASLVALASDANALALGKTTYASYCAACHRPDGGGLIGPNLTDDYWLHGGTLPEIHQTVSNGVLEKGMPPWAKTLKAEQIDAVVVYVKSLHDSHPPDAKAPQGEKVEDEATTSERDRE